MPLSFAEACRLIEDMRARADMTGIEQEADITIRDTRGSVNALLGWLKDRSYIDG